MANWDRTLVGSNPTVMLRVELWEESYNVANNTSYVRYKLSFLTSNGSRTGTWDYWLNVNGGRVATSSFGGTHSGWQTVVDSGYTHGHDVNGNGYASAQGWGDVYYGSGDTGGGISLTRLGLGPSIAGNTADQITDTTVRLGTEINNYGRGTSAATRMYYKTPEAGGWTQTSDQNDAAGYNYWTINGLESNKTYNFYAHWWNNNGDTSSSGWNSFTTLANASQTSLVVDATSATFTYNVKQGTHATYTDMGYRVKGSGANFTITSATTGTPATITVSNLLPSTTYEYRVGVITSAGTWTETVKEFTTLPAAKLIMPDGTVKNAIPNVITPGGSKSMVKVKIL